MNLYIPKGVFHFPMSYFSSENTVSPAHRKLRLVLALVCWLLIALLLYIIYGFSTQTGDESASLSLKVTQFLAPRLNGNFASLSRSQQNAVIDYLHPIVRKLAHFSEYALLGALITCAALCHIWELWARVTVAVICSGAAGLIDELSQLFTPGRAGSLRDSAIDFCGAVLGIAVICALRALILSVYRAQKEAERQRIRGAKAS